MVGVSEPELDSRRGTKLQCGNVLFPFASHESCHSVCGRRGEACEKDRGFLGGSGVFLRKAACSVPVAGATITKGLPAATRGSGGFVAEELSRVHHRCFRRS